MLNPVALPLPLALAILALIAYAAMQYTSCWPTLKAPVAPRHRLAAAPAPYRPRPWPEVTAGQPTVPATPGPAEPVAFGLLDPQVPLTEVQEYLRTIGVADWTAPLTEFERRLGVAEITRELATV